MSPSISHEEMSISYLTFLLPSTGTSAQGSNLVGSDNETQMHRTSMPDILNHPTPAAGSSLGLKNPQTLQTTIDGLLLSSFTSSRFSSTQLSLDGRSPTITSTTLTTPLSAVSSAPSEDTPSFTRVLPPLKMLFPYICNGPKGLDPSNFSTEGCIGLPTPHQSLLDNRMSMGLIFNSLPSSSSAHQPRLDNRMSVDFMCNNFPSAPFFGTLVISTETLGYFKSYRRGDLLCFNNIDIIAPAIPTRRALNNYFQTITFDLRNLADNDEYRVAPEAGWLIMSSYSARELIVKIGCNHFPRESSTAPFDLDVIEKYLRIRPEIMAKGDSINYTWKHETGGKLSWSSWT